ncbi:hypothetical protein GCM10010964_05510 [Caldovatus sediminis]|uniref:Uncharacterized protein n=1 Tax=Caldovatus sediminis TaxID=2041189 RepID=A0A8J2Z7X8_9PROT|nr:hypothetical protein [Caldovatus sediminis]GGG20165.1 hypothetical protein GCM10010964_05510 [Caldovatus sediminis]
MPDPNDPVIGRAARSASGAAAFRDALGMRERRAEAAWARIRRCRALGRPSDAEVARMVAEYHARGGRVTVCAPVRLVP